MKKQTHLRILEKAEKAVGYHLTYYVKLIEIQKAFEVMKECTQISKNILAEIRVKIPRKHLKI